MTRTPVVSVIIPIFNEEENLPPLIGRLLPVMQALGKPFEIIFTNDGSTDRSGALLTEFYEKWPDLIRIIEFNGNFGQHMAIMAAFERAAGDIVVTLDGDLQNPPEEIPKLVAAIEEGHDLAGGYRAKRKDSLFRRVASRLMNSVREKLTNVKLRDQGCMLRAFHRSIVAQVVASKEVSTFIPALAYSYAANPTEVEVEHNERQSGRSKYRLYDLARLNFDLITGFSLAPLQLFTIFGIITAGISLMLVVDLAVRRILIGPEAEGLYTLFGILYFLISVAIVGIGLVGEYVGRTYQEVRRRPRFVIRELHGFPDD